ncbi:MAG: hypothetical protein ACOZQL_10880 [Myxococcota bacterium]
MKACPCPGKQKYTCTNCGRKICTWHSAESPVSVDGAVHLVTVCHPKCDAAWWADLDAPAVGGAA